MFHFCAQLRALCTVLQADDTNSPKHCPSCVAVPVCMQHPAQLKIQKHTQWDMTYTAFRTTPILQDEDAKMLFFCLFLSSITNLDAMCVLTYGMSRRSSTLLDGTN